MISEIFTCGVGAELSLLDAQLSVLSKALGEGIVVDFQLGHPVILSIETKSINIIHPTKLLMMRERATYGVGCDGDETAHLKDVGVDGHGQPPVQVGVVRRRNDVNARHVLVHRSQHQLQFIRQLKKKTLFNSSP